MSGEVLNLLSMRYDLSLKLEAARGGQHLLCSTCKVSPQLDFSCVQADEEDNDRVGSVYDKPARYLNCLRALEKV